MYASLFDLELIQSQIDLNTAKLPDIVQLIRGFSLDKVNGINESISFSPDAVTYLYSGNITINGINVFTGYVANGFENSRTLDRTVAANMLGSEDFNGMTDRKQTKKYYFSVEGETEFWYLKWLQEIINNAQESKYRVTFDCSVQKNPSLSVWEIIEKILRDCGLVH